MKPEELALHERTEYWIEEYCCYLVEETVSDNWELLAAARQCGNPWTHTFGILKFCHAHFGVFKQRFIKEFKADSFSAWGWTTQELFQLLEAISESPVLRDNSARVQEDILRAFGWAFADSYAQRIARERELAHEEKRRFIKEIFADD